MKTDMPETPDSSPPFNLSRMSEGDVAAEIMRQMTAFRRAHDLPDEPAWAPPAPGGSPVSALSKRGIHPFLDFDAPGEGEGPRRTRTKEPWTLKGPDFSDLLAPTAAWRWRYRPSRLAVAGVAALLLATGAAAILWELPVRTPSNQPGFLIATVPAPDQPAQISASPPQRPIREDRLERAPGAASPPAIVAKLKPAIPTSASAKASKPASKQIASFRTASAPGPFDPLFDFLSPLTKQLILASQAGGENGNGAANRDVRGNGGNK